ncbi:MAG: hypothetical protein ABI273_00215 [Lacunisphaera sp.]
MTLTLVDILRGIAGLAAGGLIGFAFGLLQQAALRRHAERERAGKLNTGWSLIPGSGVRIAYLVIALALIQLICPLLFADGTQWVVSVGLALGYGWTLYTQMRERINTLAN